MNTQATTQESIEATRLQLQEINDIVGRILKLADDVIDRPDYHRAVNEIIGAMRIAITSTNTGSSGDCIGLGCVS